MTPQMEPRLFEPEPEKPVWREPGALMLACLIGGLALAWWDERSVLAGLGIGAAAMALVFWQWARTRRHYGSIHLSTDGVRIETRAGVFEHAWSEIHRIHDFGDQLVFETSAPHKRHSLMVEPHHEAHKKQILAALRAFGTVLNLRWVTALNG